MKRKEFTKDSIPKHPYVSPDIKVIEVERHSLICTTVVPADNSEEDDEWDEWQEVPGGGSIDFD